jgi:multidrug efflux system membrane fusion protein
MLAASGGLAPVSAGELQAALQWGQRAELGTLVSGVVQEVAVQPGQQVAKGDLLLRLDARGFKADVDSARAAVTQARVHFQEAEREHERALELYDRTVLSEHERQLAEIAYEDARARLQAARAHLVRAELDLERSSLVAPYDAVVLQVRVGPGQVIVSDLQSEPLVVVAERGRLVARGAVPTDELAALQPGTTVEVTVRGERYRGTVSFLGLEPERADPEPLYPLEVTLEAADAPGLRVGQAATVRWDSAGDGG